MRSLLVAAAIVGGSGPLVGCASRNLVAPDAPLGRVIIYRNGVAYFEREASVEDELTLDIPRARVDDFLKSLTVMDTSTGKPLPISYPTTRTTSGNTVRMRVALPRGRRDVRIAYVTESPAWKPSYRIVLHEAGEARLQSWAIVDNVSGEDWKRVVVGVGTTSALSFRYDLHSVRMVERETLDGGTKLAQAPPEGGSPYSVDGTTVRVLGNLDASAVEPMVVEASATTLRDSAGISLAGTTSAEAKYALESAKAHGGVVSMETFRDVPSGSSSRDFTQMTEGPSTSGSRRTTSGGPRMKPSAPSEKMGLATIAAELKDNDMRVRVEGYARRGDGDRTRAALRRANTVRESMIERGIAADRIEVVGHETFASAPDRLVRVVAIDEPARPVRARGEDDDGKPSGSALFLAEGPMTIAAGHSAMVTLFDDVTTAERVYLYDPISARGSKRFAFDAVRIRNPTNDTLDTGPMTVYANGRFLGEGLTEPIPPGAAAIVPFGLDRAIVVDAQVDTREEIESLRKIDRGIATTEMQRIRRTRLEIANRASTDARIFVRHHVSSGWTLVDPPEDLERMRDDILVPVSIPAHGQARLALEEVMPVTTTIDIRSADGSQALEVFLKKGVIDAEIETALAAVLTAQRELRNVEDALASRSEQLSRLRVRANELTAQLVALRKVGRAQGLSSDLAKRARQLAATVDELAGEVTTLETERLQRSIELGNLVAELTLDGRDGPARG